MASASSISRTASKSNCPEATFSAQLFMYRAFVNVMPHACSPSSVAAHTAEGVTSPKRSRMRFQMVA